MIRNPWSRLLILLLAAGILLEIGCRLGAEMFWFQTLGYLSVFVLRLKTQVFIGLAVAGITATYLLGNLAIAQKCAHSTLLPGLEQPPPRRRGRQESSSRIDLRGKVRLPSLPSPLSPGWLRLRSLLPLSAGLSLLVGLLLLYYGQLAFWGWQAASDAMGVPIAHFGLGTLQQFVIQLSSPSRQAVWIGGVAIALLIYPRFFLGGIAIGFSFLMGWLLTQQWLTVLQSFRPMPFNTTDPLFGYDLRFYIFSLPVWEGVNLWLIGLFLYGFLAVMLTYLLSANSLSQGWFPGFSPQQQRHLYGVGGGVMGAIALSYWLSRYELLYSSRGVTFGASYTDVRVQLPVNTALSVLALAIAAVLLGRAMVWHLKWPRQRLALLALGTFGLLAVGGIVVPQVLQYLVVQPNELAQERPYIERTIAFTRQAFDLEAIDVQPFSPQDELTEADLTVNALTIRNIRLWDEQPLLKTNRQLQQIRLYYRFPGADIDRYTLQTDTPASRPAARPPSVNPVAATEERQVLISARELDYSAVPQQAQTWINRHLIYTHGYGFTLSPVNTVGPGGLPEYFVKDISGENDRALTTSNAAIRASIPIGQPRIYYGELTNTYVMTGTRVQELDYPSGSDNAYNTYDGCGGVNVGALWRRWMFGVYLNDWRMLFTRNFSPDTKVLFRRNIHQRIRAIAPFLRFDRDPYLVIADTPQSDRQNYLYWVVDAYATSDRYPYSDPGAEGINYMRNSVKVVIDAYHGSVNFYIADPDDPLIQTWAALFPGLFQPLDAMPATLRSHLRYPVDFFRTQSERLMTYHMTDPQVFYNREDQWQIPNEVYGSEPRPVEPYYLITSLPTVPFEEFILLLPFTPQQRSNLVAWFAARSDGENYGKLLLYLFPKERLIYGPEQIEARINQDPVISQQISLWNRQGSRAIQGNLLVIPIERSLLYVEPLYLEADQNSLPTLVRVIVAYENRIVMAPTLEEGLQAIFSPNVTPAPIIIRSVEEPSP